MISDTIFGKTGFPAREIKNPQISDLRPGDISVQVDNSGRIVHVAIIWKVQKNADGEWRFNTTGNGSSSGATWPLVVSNSAVSSNCRYFTRYPD